MQESACSAGDLGSIPGSGRSPGEGNDNPLQYSCLENPMDRGAGQATVHGVTRDRHDLATKSPPAPAAAAAAKSLQSCPTLCDPTDSSPPGSPVPGILQARTLEWVAISFSNTTRTSTPQLGTGWPACHIPLLWQWTCTSANTCPSTQWQMG